MLMPLVMDKTKLRSYKLGWVGRQTPEDGMADWITDQ